MQDALAFVTVALAFAYLGFKLVLEPRLRSRRPDVRADRLVRRHRGPAPAPHRRGGCH
ncbi:MAG: hypothetical protein U0414_15245 [Polyangiaceae bacterium]